MVPVGGWWGRLGCIDDGDGGAAYFSLGMGGLLELLGGIDLELRKG